MREKLAAWRVLAGRTMLDSTMREARLGLSTGQFRSILDPARTWPTSDEWKEEGPETDHRRQSVELVLSSSGAWVGSVGGEHCWRLQMSLESAKKWLKSAKTHQISIEIAKIYTKIAENLLGFGWIWLNLTKYGRDLTGSPWIWAWSCQSWPDLYITSVGLGGSSFGEENPPLNPSASGLGRES